MSRLSDIFRTKGFLEVAKYIFGCGSSLLLKMAISSVMTVFHASLYTAYLVATICAIIFSFFYHRHITFGVSLDRNIKRFALEFVSYAFSLAILCSIDYLIVVNAATKLKTFLQDSNGITMTQIQIINNSCIIGSSLILFTLRFFVYRKIFNYKKTQECAILNNGNEYELNPTEAIDDLKSDQSNPQKFT